MLHLVVSPKTDEKKACCIISREGNEGRDESVMVPVRVSLFGTMTFSFRFLQSNLNRDDTGDQPELTRVVFQKLVNAEFKRFLR
jgi:hypothetical protein